ncbi:MAG: metallophosphoesterase family protein [Alphaproteobacteria bacterium]
MTRLYAIGDVHGRVDLLNRLADDIQADAAPYEGFRKVLITLGDYIDRGPGSREVIDFLRAPPLAGFESVNLLGNHEDLMLRFLERPSVISDWVMNGGDATLASYGVKLVPDWEKKEVASTLRDKLRTVLPDAHLKFLKQLKPYHVEGDYMFVHAGVRPGQPVTQQDAQDLIWIREPFLQSRKNHGKVVVHGHSVAYQPEVWPSEKRTSRIGIDTGAYLTGRLTCLALAGQTRTWLQTPVNPRFA